MELHQAVAGNIHRIRKSQRLSMDRQRSWPVSL